MPLQYDMSLAQTAQAIGISPGWVCRLRNQFIRGEIVDDGGKPARGGRRNENFTCEQEAKLLKPFLKEARTGGILVAVKIKPKLEAALGREMGCLRYTSSCTGITGANLPRINSIRKATLLRGKRLKKTPRNTRRNPQRLGAARIDPPDVSVQKLVAEHPDEARFGRINDVRRCRAPEPMRPLCQAMLTQEYTCAYAAVEPLTGILDTLILPHVNTGCMQVFLDEVAARHPQDKIIMVLDGAGRHAGEYLKPPVNMRLLPLPPYAPEGNPVEQVWDELREKFFHNKVFDSLDALEDQLEFALKTREDDHATIKSIVA